eukprot:3701640-Rhodomonas_salina.1
MPRGHLAVERERERVNERRWPAELKRRAAQLEAGRCVCKGVTERARGLDRERASQMSSAKARRSSPQVAICPCRLTMIPC